MTQDACPSGTGLVGLRPEPCGLGHPATIPSAGRTRTFANILDNLLTQETEDQRWLRNAAQRLSEIEEAEAPLRNQIPMGGNL